MLIIAVIMSGIISVGTIGGRVDLPQSALREFTYNLFSGAGVDIDRLISVFDNSSVENRHISVPLEWLKHDHTFTERNQIFLSEALLIGKKAIKECFKRTGASYNDIDNIFFVTSTGLSTPTLDALLVNELKLNRHIRRTPIWGLGCAGGAAALGKAWEYTTAFPEKNALVLAIELCSLTFQKDDLSKSNVVAAALFSDGAGAVLIAGNKSKFFKDSRVEIIDSMSTIYYESLDVMGWEIVDSGFKVIFSRDIPSIVEKEVHPNILELLEKNKIDLKEIRCFIAHPGGVKVINAYEKSLNLDPGTLKYSRSVLRKHGNMSSPSVLFVLDEFLTANQHKANEYGLLSSLGPGFSSELVLFRTL